MWVSFEHRAAKEGRDPKQETHRCGFCVKKVYAYGFCGACFPIGTTPGFACCGPSTGRNCFQQHSNGVGARHTMQKRKREDQGESSAAGSR